MTELLLAPPIDRDAQDTGAWLTPGQATLRQMVLGTAQEREISVR